MRNYYFPHKNNFQDSIKFLGTEDSLGQILGFQKNC